VSTKIDKIIKVFNPIMHKLMLYDHIIVIVSLTQLIGTMYKICKVRDSNSGHYQKKKDHTIYSKICPRSCMKFAISAKLGLDPFFPLYM